MPRKTTSEAWADAFENTYDRGYARGRADALAEAEAVARQPAPVSNRQARIIADAIADLPRSMPVSPAPARPEDA